MRLRNITRGEFPSRYFHMFGNKMKTVTFLITHGCNLRCSYCYEHNKDDNKKMTIDVAKKCIDFLFKSYGEEGIWINSKDCNGIILDFMGGEPLLEIELIDQIMNYFLEKAIELNHPWVERYFISTTTNGVLYFSNEVQSFINKWKAKLNITVTVDGDQVTHDACRVDRNGNGSYKFASAAFLDLINNKGAGKETKLTIAPGNVDNVFNSHTFMMENYNIDILRSNYVFEEGWNTEHATIFYYELKRLTDWLIDTNRIDDIALIIFQDDLGHPLHSSYTNNWCGGTGAMLTFDVDGSILPCFRYSKLSVGDTVDPMIVGDADRGIGSTEEELKKVRDLEEITRQSQSTEECINCPIGHGCAWCSAYNYEVFGTANKRATFICQMHKATVLANVYYWNRYFQYVNTAEVFVNNVPDEWALEIIPADELNMLKELESSNKEKISHLPKDEVNEYFNVSNALKIT